MAMRVNGNITGSVSNSKANMSGKLTTGIVNIGGGTNDGYSKEEVDELLNGKANADHIHDEYASKSVASTNYKVMSEHVTRLDEKDIELEGKIDGKADAVHRHDEIQSQIDDLKTSVSNGKTILASAITDKGVSTLATDTFQTMANNIREIPQEGGGNSFYEDLYNARTKNGTNMSGLFSYCTANTLDLSGLDTSNATNMEYMFRESKFTSLDLSNLNTSNVTSMKEMFYLCNMLKELRVDNFNTSKVTSMVNMFGSCSNIKTLDLSSFDTSKVTDATNMFNGNSNVNITVTEGLWTLETEPYSYNGYNLNFNIIPIEIKSIEVETDIENHDSLDNHIISYTLRVQPENAKMDLEVIYDDEYMFTNGNKIYLKEGAQGVPLSITFRSKMNNDVCQTINFTLNPDYVFPGFDGTIDFTTMYPQFPEWFSENISGEYTFELGKFIDDYYGLVSNNIAKNNSFAMKTYLIQPEKDYTMTITSKVQSENNYDYLNIFLSTTIDGGFNALDNNPDASSKGKDYVEEDFVWSTNLDGGVNYLLAFVYRKDTSGNKGADRACIRTISFEEI